MGKLSDLATANSRAKLPPLPPRESHWRFLTTGRALGWRPYRSPKGSGAWVARCLVPGTTRYRKTTLGPADDERRAPDGESVLSFEQAQRAATEWCEDMEHAFEGREPKDRKPYTVERAMTDYLEWVRLHRKAPHQVRHVMNAHILPALGEVEVKDLDTARLRRWHEGIAKSPPRRRTAEGKPQKTGELRTPEDYRKRKSTANRALTVLKAGLNMAYREGKVPSDRAWSRLKPFKGVDRPKTRFLEGDEVVRLLNACDPDFRRIVRGALLTGCRYGELCRLRVGDFKARPMPMILLEDTKSGKGRHVYLNEEGAAFFEGLTAGRRDAEPMFLRDDGEPWGRSHQTRRMLEASETAEIDPPAGFHELRHTYASHYLMNGGDLPDLAQQLGHADTRMTLRHYARLADRWRAERAQRHVPSFGAGGDAEAGGEVVSMRRRERR